VKPGILGLTLASSTDSPLRQISGSSQTFKFIVGGASHSEPRDDFSLYQTGYAEILKACRESEFPKNQLDHLPRELKTGTNGIRLE
jgi:hypothetical protein